MALARQETALFVCDIQERFRDAIYSFDAMVATSRRMVQVAKMFEMPIITTEQNPKALGATVAELGIQSLPQAVAAGTWPKKKFSMYIPEVAETLQSRKLRNIILVGIESHVCVLQTTFDLLAAGYQVYVLADAVSSCNREEIPLALSSMRQAGAVITTSESISFRLMGDASDPNFKSFSTLVKEEKGAISTSLRTLCGEGQQVKASL